MIHESGGRLIQTKKMAYNNYYEKWLIFYLT